MKREILFRGKRIDNGEWVECDLVHRNGKIYVFPQDGLDSADRYEVIPETVGQFTGLTDKNGKKIFEHDRIKYKCGDIAEVIFTEYGAFVGETESLSHENIGGVLTEVIGNKWEE